MGWLDQHEVQVRAGFRWDFLSWSGCYLLDTQVAIILRKRKRKVAGKVNLFTHLSFSLSFLE